MENCCFKLLIRKCVRLNTRRRRYCCGYLYILCCASALLILLINLQSFKWQTNVSDQDKDRPQHCDQTIIRKHYMYNERPEQLFAREPIRPSFSYELPNENFCSSIKPHAVIFVVSKSTNFGARNAIRRTWGNLKHVNFIQEFAHLRLKLLFFIDIDESHLLSIELEQSIYNDIVQVRLPQHYTLSTYRDMAILDWTETFCSQALMTIKTDDDIFLNIFLLANLLNNITTNIIINQSEIECKHMSSFDSLAIIYGVKFKNAPVIRYTNNPKLDRARYIVTDDEYPCTYYPDYMSGFGYIINRNARLKLLCAFFRHEKLFHMSDAYVTGILPEYMNIRRQSLSFKISFETKDNCDLFFHKPKAYACASSLHYQYEQSSSITEIDIFQTFNIYWKRLYANRLIYKNRIRYLY
ncbi:unnamed protein product [Rotaria sp. Silwood1]|nr:unnamed protein product [Rotaria sp. Silwood1]CAF4557478.1 unnamed protein product [Rotaria sp. Silwood1]